MHLIGALAFLPYGVCVDHFQHEVYANPDASAAERHGMWRGWRSCTCVDGLRRPGVLTKGGRWQAKHHIYASPFYYIDYTLAQCCAMQFWVGSRRDYGTALEAYVQCVDAAAPHRSRIWCAPLGWSPRSPMGHWRMWCGRRRGAGSLGTPSSVYSASADDVWRGIPPQSTIALGGTSETHEARDQTKRQTAPSA